MTINDPRIIIKYKYEREINNKLYGELHGLLHGNYMLNLKNIFYG